MQRRTCCPLLGDGSWSRGEGFYLRPRLPAGASPAAGGWLVASSSPARVRLARESCAADASPCDWRETLLQMKWCLNMPCQEAPDALSINSGEKMAAEVRAGTKGNALCLPALCFPRSLL